MFLFVICCSNQDVLKTIVYSLLKFYHEVYIWCFQGVPWSSWLHSQDNASKMESKFLGPQHLECWTLMFWFCKFYFLGYKFRCPWAKDVSVLRDLQWSCGCCKGILFKFFCFNPFWVFSSFEFVWICVSLNNEYIMNTSKFPFISVYLNPSLFELIWVYYFVSI
jgi:hypothetical protein